MVITSAEWERKLDEVKLRKDDMNRLIMNFLVTEVKLLKLFIMPNKGTLLQRYGLMTFLPHT